MNEIVIFRGDKMLSEMNDAEVVAEIDALLPSVLVMEVGIERARTRIGSLFNEVRSRQIWKKEGMRSFDEFIESRRERYDYGRTQIFAFARVVRELLPLVGEEKLNGMGITKALMLCHAKEATGTLPSDEIVDMAADDSVKIKQFRQILLGAKKLPDIPGGKYHSIEYFATADQQAAISSALLSAKRTENLTGADEVQMGCALECLAAEYLGANSGVL